MTDTPSSRFQGTADNGATGRVTGKAPVDEAELKTMSPEAIVEAMNEGRLDGLLGRN
ncbi:MAG: hypothetical protein ACRDTX_30780 [Pseudonocardiaceae bacterium]